MNRRTIQPRERVRCAGCGRRMYQAAPKNRDYTGGSWHYDCLTDSLGSMRDYYLAKWADDRRRYGWPKQ